MDEKTSKFERIKDVSIALTELSDNTGIDYDILAMSLEREMDRRDIGYEEAYALIEEVAWLTVELVEKMERRSKHAASNS